MAVTELPNLHHLWLTPGKSWKWLPCCPVTDFHYHSLATPMKNFFSCRRLKKWYELKALSMLMTNLFKLSKSTHKQKSYEGLKMWVFGLLLYSKEGKKAASGFSNLGNFHTIACSNMGVFEWNLAVSGKILWGIWLFIYLSLSISVCVCVVLCVCVCVSFCVCVFLCVGTPKAAFWRANKTRFPAF